jgi:cytochrome c oxidase subunit 3
MEHAPGHYYVPHGTRWPILGSVGLFTMMLGTALRRCG